MTLPVRMHRRLRGCLVAVSEYTEVLASLYALEAAKGMDFKLERVALALKNLGDPHRQFPAVHIAGTNGKGSVAAMLHAILGAAGYRVGLYTSPHLVDFTERIRVGEVPIPQDDVVASVREIHAAATLRGIALTFFEFVTVMAFWHFARQAIDLAVVEVGLGGRLDATNVIDPLEAIITTIGLDHEEFLGDTLVSVAREKAGIIKAERPLIVGNVPPEALSLLESVTAERAVVPYRFGKDFTISGGGSWRFEGFGSVLDDVKLPLRGRHQAENAAVAMAAAMRLRDHLQISDDAVRRGLAGVRWPGRLDIIRTHPLVVLDGAHNVDGIAALVRELSEIVGSRRVHLLFGVMRDKHWQPMVDLIGPVVTSALLTPTLPPRGEAPEVLAPAFNRYCRTSVARSAAHGFEALLNSTPREDAILVAGSLFLVGEIFAHLLRAGGQQNVFHLNSVPVQP